MCNHPSLLPNFKEEKEEMASCNLQDMIDKYEAKQPGNDFVSSVVEGMADEIECPVRL